MMSMLLTMSNVKLIVMLLVMIFTAIMMLMLLLTPPDGGAVVQTTFPTTAPLSTLMDTALVVVSNQLSALLKYANRR